jgi:WD40 repeat protein
MPRFVLPALLLVGTLAHAAAPPSLAVDLLGDPLPPGAVLRLGTERGFHGSALYLAWSPDEKSLAYLDILGEVVVFDMPSFRKRWQSPYLKEHTTEHNSSMVFSPDGAHLAVCSFMSRVLRVLDARTGKDLARLEKVIPWAAVFAQDGTLIFGDGGKQAVFSWDWKKNKEPHKLFDAKHIRSLALTPDGKSIVTLTGSEGGPIQYNVAVVDAKSGKQSSRYKVPTKWFETRLSPDGRFVVFPEDDRKAAGLMDVATGKVLHRLESELLYPTDLKFSADGSTLAVNSRDGTARVLDTKAGKVRKYPLGLKGIELLALSKDGTSLAATVRADSCIHAFALKALGARELGPKYPGHRRGGLKVAFSPDGKEIVTLQHSSWTTPVSDWEKWSFRRWDASTGKEKLVVEQDLKGVVWEFAVTHDGKLAMAGTDDGRMWIYDAVTGKHLRDWAGPAHKAGKLTKNGRRYATFKARLPVFSWDGKQLFAQVDQAIWRWDVATGKELPAITDWHKGDDATKLPEAMPWSPYGAAQPDGNLVLVAGASSKKGRASLIDSADTKQRRALDAEDWNAWSIGFSRDGRMIVVGANENYRSHYIRLIETATGKERARFDAGDVRIDAIAVSPCGRLLAAGGGWKEGLRLWSLETGKLLRTFPGKHDPSTRLVFSPDSTRLLAGTGRNTALVWDVAAYLEREKAKAPTKAELEKAWEALAGKDAWKAYAATWELSRSPAQSVPFIRERLKGLKGLDAKLPAVARVEDGSAVLIGLRALEALERASTPEAAKLLKELGRGEGRVGEEARAAVARWRR